MRACVSTPTHGLRGEPPKNLDQYRYGYESKKAVQPGSPEQSKILPSVNCQEQRSPNISVKNGKASSPICLGSPGRSPLKTLGPHELGAASLPAPNLQGLDTLQVLPENPMLKLPLGETTDLEEGDLLLELPTAVSVGPENDRVRINLPSKKEIIDLTGADSPAKTHTKKRKLLTTAETVEIAETVETKKVRHGLGRYIDITVLPAYQQERRRLLAEIGGTTRKLHEIWRQRGFVCDPDEKAWEPCPTSLPRLKNAMYVALFDKNEEELKKSKKIFKSSANQNLLDAMSVDELQRLARAMKAIIERNERIDKKMDPMLYRKKVRSICHKVRFPTNGA